MKNIQHSTHASLIALVSSAVLVIVIATNSTRTVSGNRITRDKTGSPAATVHVVQRDNPFIKLSDGHEVFTSADDGDNSSELRPLALASADFNEDGIADLISAHAGAASGLLRFYPGADSARVENAPASRVNRDLSDSPFLEPHSFEVSDAPDFIGAGDFDADGHFDVVVASRDSEKLRLMSGDAHGGFQHTKDIALPGRVTAMAVGDINRRDGLADIIVGVGTATGPALLIFESSNGAMTAEPETINLNSDAIAIAIGQFDNDQAVDVAVGAGSEVLIVHGRDRNLSQSDDARAQVKPARSVRYELPFLIAAMSPGDFDGDAREELAIASNDGAIHIFERIDKQSAGATKRTSWKLSDRPVTSVSASNASRPVLVAAKISSLPKSDLLIGDAVNHRLNVVHREAPKKQTADPQPDAIDADNATSHVSVSTSDDVAAVLPMKLRLDARDGLVILKKGQTQIATVTPLTAMTFTVTNTADSGAGSLRQAIINANGNVGVDTIVFNIGSGSPFINLSSALPSITEALNINGNTGGATRVVIDGTNAGAGANGLYILSGACSINGLVIDNFSANGILIQTGGGNVITNCLVGIDATGTFATPNVDGIFVSNSANNLIGGTASGVNNVISGNNVDGIRLDGSASTGNTIQSNYIGTNLGGTTAAGNGFNGVVIIAASNNTVGGSVTGSRNIISGNQKNGVGMNVSGTTNASGNLVQRNYIGTNISGTEAVPNWQNGVLLINVSSNTIGGTSSGARNLISGNFERGVKILNSTATGNQVLGNYIGTNFDGSASIGNEEEGVRIEDAPSNSLGGTATGAGNVISGNGGSFSSGANGITITGTTATGNSVLGNIIGLNASGSAALANSGDGVLIENASSSIIGGTSTGARNIISGNRASDFFFASAGVEIQGSANLCTIQGNYIGTDITGSVAVGNSISGIEINEDVRNTTVGGSTAAARNVISGNGLIGISIAGNSTTTTGNVVRGNYIGTNAGGTADLGNGGDGIEIGSSAGNTIGGTTGTTPGGACTGDCNLISGNSKNGIEIINGQSIANLIQGNYIGTNWSGTAAIKNDENGMHLWNVDTNTIGGTTPAARNIISGNGANGIWTEARFDAGDTIQGNYIGVATNGTASLGNMGHGILIDDSAKSTIGGTAAGAGNTIGFNGGDGIAILYGQDHYGTGNKILSNSIFSNAGLGIDLDNNGVTANDAGDGDVGANNRQNFPVLSVANNTGGSTGIAGSLNSTANTTFTIQFFSSQFCDASGSGEGQFYLGSTNVTTNASGNAAFAVAFPLLVPIDFSVTATATDPGGNTSEFSACRVVTACAYSISPMSQSYGASGGTGSVSVTAGPGCTWTSVSNATWITITSGGSGTGNGTLNYSVAANTSPARTGTINIAGQTFTVNQSGGCAFTINPTSHNHSAAAENGSVGVTAGTGCAWTATESLSWVSITSSSSGSGNGTMNYSVAANTGPARNGTMTVAGQTFTINQASGCTFTLGTSHQSFAAAAATGNTVSVTTPAGCAWTASVTSGSSFITITAGASGTGNGTVTYSVSANASSSIRNGTMTIAGQAFTVYQGIQFADVPVGAPFYTEIGKLSSRGVTLGCSAGNYCPNSNVLRQEMAAFIIRSLGDFNPPPPASQRFADVPSSNPFYAFIDEMAVRQITLGCGGGNYCPASPVLRQEMAAFVIRARGDFNPPVPPNQRFQDVPPSNPFYKFIDQMAVLGITLGCSASPPLYCPTDTVTRAQMAAFLVRAFNL